MWLTIISVVYKGGATVSEFVKKNLMGYKTVLGGHSDPECSHVILTIGEYNNWTIVKKVDRGMRKIGKAQPRHARRTKVQSD